jgi:FkbM family methyltransferase
MNPTLSRTLLAALTHLTANSLGQRLLQKTVTAVQYLQGIGTGSDVTSSGERAVLSTLKLKSNSERGICIFDVGANKGQYLTLASAMLNGCKFHVHSFEPSRCTYDALRKGTQFCRNATLNNFGLGRERGEMKLFYDSALSGLASLTKRRLTHFATEMTLSEHVRIETVDRYCEDHQIEYIDLLKVDVEGHELDVLNGANDMFRNSAIGMVQFEFGGCNIDTKTFLQDFFYFFSDYGMRMARLTPSGYFCEIAFYDEVQEQFRTSNFVCYRA